MICIALSMFASWTSKPSWFTVGYQSRCPNWASGVRQKVSWYGARILLTEIGGSYLGLPSNSLVFGSLCAPSSLCAKVRPETGVLSRFSTAYNCKSSSSRLLSLPDVFNHNIVSAAWCFMPAQCTTSKSNLKSFRRNRASCLMKFGRLRIYLRAS